MQALSGSTEANERLIDLLSSMRELPEVTDEHGNVLKHEWGGRYWMELPTCGLDVLRVWITHVQHFRACANFVNIRSLTSKMQIDVEAGGHRKSMMHGSLRPPP